jgi:beta-mannosidase
MTKTRISITEWKWRLSDSNGEKKAESLDLKNWRPVTSFPSVIQQELLANQFIPNYHIGENEREIQWAGACDWEYRTTFLSPTTSSSHIDLVFDGLDTYAKVQLNGNVILKNENQFIPARVSVSPLLKRGEENELSIIFESALKAGTRLEEKFGKQNSMMRDRRRMHLRKAQYSWGWDWGPVVVTSGPWKPIYLETYDYRIEDVYITTKVTTDHSSADISIEFTANHANPGMRVAVAITDAEGKETSNAMVPIENAKNSSIELKAKDPKLWWPNGQGSAHLYTAHIRLLSSTSKTLDTSTVKFGVRTIEVIQRPLKAAPGNTFMFRVNGRDIFSQGGDWIPADNLLPSVSRKRYFDWIKIAKFGHLNMIRVWGGGVYESEDFFDACDEMGILVWHDFAFACGDFPTHASFLKSVQQEADAQVKRLRNRASLALLAGDNEDFMLADWEK